MTTRPEFLFDKRIVMRNIKRGKLTKKEYEQFLASLGDAGKKAVPLFGEEKPQGDRAH